MKRLHLGLLALHFALLNAMQEPEMIFGMDKKDLAFLIDTHFKVLHNSDIYLGKIKEICLDGVYYSLLDFVWNLSVVKNVMPNVAFNLAGEVLESEWYNQYDQCVKQLLEVILPKMKTIYCDSRLNKKKKNNCNYVLRPLLYTLLNLNQLSSLTYLIDMKIKCSLFLPKLMDKMEEWKKRDFTQHNQMLTISCQLLNSLKMWPEYESESQLKQKYTDEKWEKKKKYLDEEKSCFTRSIYCWLPELMGLLLIRDLPARAKMFKEHDLYNLMRAKYKKLSKHDYVTFNQATRCLQIAEALDINAILSSMPKRGQHYHTKLPKEIMSELNKFYINAVAFNGSAVYSSSIQN